MNPLSVRLHWRQNVQVERPKVAALADGLLAPLLLAICHAKPYLMVGKCSRLLKGHRQ